MQEISLIHIIRLDSNVFQPNRMNNTIIPKKIEVRAIVCGTGLNKALITISADNLNFYLNKSKQLTTNDD